MANRFKKCSICGKRKRATILSITPSPYEINPDAEICVGICPQPPTKICDACFNKLSSGIQELLTWYFIPMKCSLMRRGPKIIQYRPLDEKIVKALRNLSKLFKKLSKPKNECSNHAYHCKSL